MNCREFEIEWAAQEDSSHLTSAMEAHRQLCRACSDLVEDISYIVAQARQMRQEVEPPPHIWFQLAERLEREGLIRNTAPPGIGIPDSRRARNWFARLPMGFAYAAVFFVAVGVMYMQSRLQGPGIAPPLLTVSQPAPELSPQSPQVTEDVQVLAQQIPPEHRAIFVSNWNQVNSSIQQLNDFLETHPGDPFARLQLMTAFQQREQLRETFVRWPGSRPALRSAGGEEF